MCSPTQTFVSQEVILDELSSLPSHVTVTGLYPKLTTTTIKKGPTSNSYHIVDCPRQEQRLQPSSVVLCCVNCQTSETVRESYYMLYSAPSPLQVSTEQHRD